MEDFTVYYILTFINIYWFYLLFVLIFICLYWYFLYYKFLDIINCKICNLKVISLVNISIF